MEARHKKELKALDTERRAAIKKIKGTAGKGKKAKELIAAAETEYDTKLKDLQQKHVDDIEKDRMDTGDGAVVAEDASNSNEKQPDPSAERKNAKLEKARKKREKAREKEREREKQIEEETANAGPSARDVENDLIRAHLEPFHLAIAEVVADGHCLYRAVAAQSDPDHDFQSIRKLIVFPALLRCLYAILTPHAPMTKNKIGRTTLRCDIGAT